MDAALLELLADTVTIEPWASQDAYGQPTYGAAVTHQCHIRGQMRMVATPGGEERVSSVTVYLATAAGITVRDRITLPARFAPTQPVILAVASLADEAGAYTDVVYC